MFRGDTIILNTSGHCTKLLKVNGTKKSIKHSKNRQYEIKGRICQNRTVGKDRFVRKSSVAQIEKCKTNES